MKILITGEGGQGIQTMARILAGAAYRDNLQVTYMPHYGVEMRMGISRAFVIISQEPITYPSFSQADIVSVMAKRNLPLVKNYLDKKTRIINAINLAALPQERQIPSSTFNMIVLGIILQEINKGDVKISKDTLLQEINDHLGKKANLIKNRAAFELGYDLEEKLYCQSLKSIKSADFPAVINKDKNKEHIKYPDLCKSCGLCLIKCPVQALSWDADKINFISRPLPKVNLKKCTGCGTCQQICPDCAIKINKIS